MMLLVPSAVLLSSAGLASLAGLLFFVPPAHMYRQLRGAYGVSRGGALWRTMLLTLFALVVLVAFIMLMAALGAFD